jgi:hypothetical protein
MVVLKQMHQIQQMLEHKILIRNQSPTAHEIVFMYEILA